MAGQAEPAAIVAHPESYRSGTVPRVLVMAGRALNASVNQKIVGDGSSQAACRRRWVQTLPPLHLKPVVVDADRVVALVMHRFRAHSIVTRHAGVARADGERKRLPPGSLIQLWNPRRRRARGNMAGGTIIPERRRESENQECHENDACDSDCHCDNLCSDENERSVPRT